MVEDAVGVGVAREDEGDAIARNNMIFLNNQIINGRALDHLGSDQISRILPLPSYEHWMASRDSQAAGQLAHLLLAADALRPEDAEHPRGTVAADASSDKVSFSDLVDPLSGAVSHQNQRFWRKAAAAAPVVLVVVVVVVDFRKLLRILDDRHLLIGLDLVRSGGFGRIHAVVDVIGPVGYVVEQIAAEHAEARISEIIFDLQI